MASNNLFDVMSECCRIMKIRSLHIRILTFIFLMPIPLSFPLFTFFTNIPQTQLQQQTTNPLFYPLYFLFVMVFYTCAVTTITYTVYHCSLGTPIKLRSSINSISSSFFPLFTIMLLSFPCCFPLGLLVILRVLLVDVTVSYSSPYFIGFSVLLPVVLYSLQVNYSLAPVIVVVESCSGFEAFRKSARLMKGMKREALSSLLSLGFWIGLLVWICSDLSFRFTWILYGIFIHDDWTLYHSLLTGVISAFVANFMLFNISFNTVLYLYCKANHGELAKEEFGKHRVNLPSHDEIA